MDILLKMDQEDEMEHQENLVAPNQIDIIF